MKNSGNRPQVVVSRDPQVSKQLNSDKKLPHTTKPLNTRGIKFLVVAATAIFLALLIGLFIDKLVIRHTRQQIKDAAFVVNGVAYSQSQVKALVNYPTSIGYRASVASFQAYNLYKDQAAAAKAGIYIHQAQLTAEENNLIKTLSGKPGSASAKPWIDLVAYDNVLKTDLSSGNTSQPAQGFIFNFWFNQHNTYGPDGTSPAGNGDPNLIAQDKAYAQTQANNGRSALLAKQITPNQLLNKINTDPKLNQYGVPGSNLSTQFGNSSIESWQNQLNDSSVIINYINKQKQPGISQVTVGQLSVPTNVSPNGELDSYFYIVELDQLPTPSISYLQFQKTLLSIPTIYRGLK